MELAGAGALVAGGASGLGAATVRALHRAGATVTVLDTNADAAKRLVDDLGNRVRFAEGDVTDAAAVQGAVDHAADGVPLRVVANCAGLGPSKRTLNRTNEPHDLESFTFVIGVNLVGTFNVLRLAAAKIASVSEPMDDGERGVIVNTASIAAFEGQIGQIAYAASKGGIVALTLPAARDLAAVGIRVVTIAPGTFDTQLMASFSKEVRAGLAESIPFPQRIGEPAEFGALVCHVVENRYLNGDVIRLDGALRMPPR
jgi:NAD(P)-dependent dehydrogenase (short-subunit alcohol dehydrogenase family)